MPVHRYTDTRAPHAHYILSMYIQIYDPYIYPCIYLSVLDILYDIPPGGSLTSRARMWLLATSQRRSATAALAPMQTAFAKSSLCEVVAMDVQAHVDALHGSTGWLLLQVDLKNSINCIHRLAILAALEQRWPEMLPWVRQASQPAPLVVGREVIWSTRGVQQGEPLGPSFFAACFQAALDTLPTGGARHRWYLDDGVFMGLVAEVEEVLGALQRALLPLGLELNIGRRRCGARVWLPRLSPEQPRPTCIWRRARRCWGSQSTVPSTPRRWGPTWGH